MMTFEAASEVVSNFFKLARLRRSCHHLILLFSCAALQQSHHYTSLLPSHAEKRGEAANCGWPRQLAAIVFPTKCMWREVFCGLEEEEGEAAVVLRCVEGGAEWGFRRHVRQGPVSLGCVSQGEERDKSFTLSPLPAWCSRG